VITPIVSEVGKMSTKIYVICFWCKQPVGRIQERKGKAFCYRCQKAIFGKQEKDREPRSTVLYMQRKRPLQKDEGKHKERMMTPQEWIRRYRIHDV